MHNDDIHEYMLSSIFNESWVSSTLHSGHAKLRGWVWWVLRRLPVGSDSNYKQQRGREVLHQEDNNELQNSHERYLWSR